MDSKRLASETKSDLKIFRSIFEIALCISLLEIKTKWFRIRENKNKTLKKRKLCFGALLVWFFLIPKKSSYVVTVNIFVCFFFYSQGLLLLFRFCVWWVGLTMDCNRRVLLTCLLHISSSKYTMFSSWCLWQILRFETVPTTSLITHLGNSETCRYHMALSIIQWTTSNNWNSKSKTRENENKKEKKTNINTSDASSSTPWQLKRSKLCITG